MNIAIVAHMTEKDTAKNTYMNGGEVKNVITANITSYHVRKLKALGVLLVNPRYVITTLNTEPVAEAIRAMKCQETHGVIIMRKQTNLRLKGDLL